MKILDRVRRFLLQAMSNSNVQASRKALDAVDHKDLTVRSEIHRQQPAQAQQRQEARKKVEQARIDEALAIGKVGFRLEDWRWINDIGLTAVSWNPVAECSTASVAAEFADAFTAEGRRGEANSARSSGFSMARRV